MSAEKFISQIRRLGGIILVAITCFAFRTEADSVQMLNGDRYVGRVLSVDGSTVRLQNANLGAVSLSRTNVQQIVFGDATNAAAFTAPHPASTNGGDQLTRQIQTLGIDPKLRAQIQQQFLSAAGPEANAKFNALVQGLATGTLSLEDIRAQARNAVTEARGLQKELGAESGEAEALEGYLQILESFLGETQAPTNSPTTAPPTKK